MKKKKGKKGFRFFRWLFLYIPMSFVAITVLWVLMLRWVPVYVTPLMAVRAIENWDDSSFTTHKTWEPMEKISPNLARAVIASEDARFFTHNGFDWIEIDKAIDAHRKGKKLRGASTISQQTAKNVFLWPGGGWFRKGLEAYFTMLIELMWDKHRIMEVYLNIIETGDGIYGVDAVAWQNFGRGADRLTRANCALIAATLPNPLKYSSKNPSRYMLRRQTQILQQMRNLGKLEWEKDGR